MHRYFIIYKPFQVLSQFTSEEGKKTLADLYDLPKDVYPVGRLDFDSEGLLILTNDTKLNHLLLNPKHRHEREYWVQVEGLITDQALKLLQSGITISIDGKEHKTLPCNAYRFNEAISVSERNPPIRFRKNIPVSWVSLSLTEGKNRQVRRMTAKVGFPTLRLIRYRIENITLGDLAPGGIKELSKQEIYNNLFAKK
jgi:23S rRNA pseudouridine2457 synthase